MSPWSFIRSGVGPAGRSLGITAPGHAARTEIPVEIVCAGSRRGCNSARWFDAGARERREGAGLRHTRFGEAHVVAPASIPDTGDRFAETDCRRSGAGKLARPSNWNSGRYSTVGDIGQQSCNSTENIQMHRNGPGKGGDFVRHR